MFFLLILFRGKVEGKESIASSWEKGIVSKVSKNLKTWEKKREREKKREKKNAPDGGLEPPTVRLRV